MSAPAPFNSSAAAFFGGVKSALTSVFFLVLMGTYIGIGALAHDFGLASWWLALSTLLVWAAPAQVILMSALGTGAALIEVAIAVELERDPAVSHGGGAAAVAARPGHAPARSSAADAFHLGQHVGGIAAAVAGDAARAPHRVLQRLVGRLHGHGGDVSASSAFTSPPDLPPLFAGTLLFLTPMSFLISTARNARMMVDRLALVLGLMLGPLLTYRHVQLDLMWTGMVGGSLAYVVHRLREAAA